MADDLERVLDVLNAHPDISIQLSLSKIFRFIRHASRLKDDICLTQPASAPLDLPPTQLPPVAKTFLSILLSLDAPAVDQCWSLFKELIWDNEYIRLLEEDPEEGFRTCGLEHGLSMLPRPSTSP